MFNIFAIDHVKHCWGSAQSQRYKTVKEHYFILHVLVQVKTELVYILLMMVFTMFSNQKKKKSYALPYMLVTFDSINKQYNNQSVQYHSCL